MRLKPSCGEAYYYLGEQRAWKMSSRPCSLVPSMRSGTIHEKRGELDQAIDMYGRSLSLDPTHARAAYSRGACHNMKGNIAQALGAWGSA